MSSTKVFGRCVVDVVVVVVAVAAVVVVVVVVCPFSILAPKTVFTLKKGRKTKHPIKTEFVATTNQNNFFSQPNLLLARKFHFLLKSH
jgi:hypothetical protein